KAQARVQYAKERGGNVEDAEDHLAEARNALALREYHRIRPLASKAIEKADAQRKYARAETILDRAAADVEAARRDGVNIAEARKVLTQARDALRRGVYADVPLLAQRARGSLQEARRYAVADVGLRESAAEAARDSNFRAIMEQSLQIILLNASRGLDPALARQLLKDVDDAVSLGKKLDMQALIDKRMADADAETESKLNVRVLQARDDIVALRQGGQNDTVGLEGKLADAAI